MPVDKTVLILDDEDALRQFIAIVLRRHGFKALESRSRSEAEGAWKSVNGEVDVLLADVYLKAETGLEFADFARSSNPAVHVILMTGALDQDVRGLAGSPFPVLLKPFSAAQLLAEIRRKP